MQKRSDDRARRFIESLGMSDSPKEPVIPVAAVTPIVDRLAASNERIKKAAFALYVAGHWSTTDIPEGDQKILWEELREALGVDKEMARRLGLG